MSADPTPGDDLFAPSLVEATTRRLRNEILSGALAPGERIIEEQICQRFSISRAPVRESLRLLVQHGDARHQALRTVSADRVGDLTCPAVAPASTGRITPVTHRASSLAR